MLLKPSPDSSANKKHPRKKGVSVHPLSSMVQMLLFMPFKDSIGNQTFLEIHGVFPFAFIAVFIWYMFLSATAIIWAMLNTGSSVF